MIFVLKLPLKVATIILSCIFSMLFSDFRACGPISVPTPPIVALTEFSHADAVDNVHPLPVSRYLKSSLWVYLCSCKYIISILWSIAEAVSSNSRPILFKVLMLNAAICIVHFHFSNFCFSLSSVAYFSNTVARAPTSAGHAPFLLAWNAMQFGQVAWVWVMVIFQGLFLFLSTEAALIDKQL